jgi:hypothetical protein
MAAIPLNTFKTLTAQVTTSEQTLYTAPLGITTIFLVTQVANTQPSTTTVTFKHVRGGVETSITSNLDVAPNDSALLIQGKLVLETGDSIKISSDSNNLQFLASVLETANA